MKRKNFKHTTEFKTKARLREEHELLTRNLGMMVQEHHRELTTMELLKRDVVRLQNKVMSDAFLIDEMKNQVAQQHIQLCLMKDKESRGQQLARLSPDRFDWSRKDTGRGPASALPERTQGAGSTLPVMPSSGGDPAPGGAFRGAEAGTGQLDGAHTQAAQAPYKYAG